ncbi:MAG: hypothetical protein ABIH03_16090 [Pseudomonadota bacterium]
MTTDETNAAHIDEPQTGIDEPQTGKVSAGQYAPSNRHERRRDAALVRKEKARLRIQQNEHQKKTKLTPEATT